MGVTRRIKTAVLFAIAFALGMIAAGLLQPNGAVPASAGFELPTSIYAGLTGNAISRESPTDRLGAHDIVVTRDKVELDLQDAILAKFTPTHSMDPVLDESANALEVRPESADEIGVGDIVAYTPPGEDYTIIHRVIKKGEDQLGTYFIVKGDNNPTADPGKVRFEDVKSVVVAIIY